MTANLLSIYNRLPISFTHGEGCYLWDDANNKYLDVISGIGVCALGHKHPAITEAIIEQAQRLLHVSNMFEIKEQIDLASRLTHLSQMDRAFFCNSGAEANEAALKLARLYGHEQGIALPEIIVFEQSFHGRSLATLSASAGRKVQAGFEPLVSGFIRAPFNDMQALHTIASQSKNIVAIMAEPILGNGGIIIPQPDYLAKLRQLCDEHGWLLILDEIQTGLARTGSMFYCQQTNVRPDILTSAKALGNGIPIGACLTRDKANDLFQPGKHGSTFGGNPFASFVANKVLEILEKEQFADHAKKIGNYLLTQLQEALGRTKGIKEIRGCGLMLGIELEQPCLPILKIGLKHKILFNVTADKVLRLLPPLIMQKEEADLIVERMAAVVNEYNHE